MKRTKIVFGDEAKEKFKEGIDLVANCVKVTLGPKGRNVALKQIGPLPTRVINDGVTIAEQVKSDDPLVQAGIESVIEICRKTNFNAGDGTTQTALLAQKITDEGKKRLMNDINPIDVKKELEDDLDKLLAHLKDLSKKVEKIEDVRSIATISGNNDTKIGDAVAEVMEKVGMNAAIRIKKGSDEAIKTESAKGIWFDKGYRVPAFVNNPKITSEHTDPYIFLIDENLRWSDEIMDFFEKIQEAGMERIIIIANEIEGDALYALALTNKAFLEKNGSIAVCGIEAPFAGPDRKDFLEDIAIYTGAKVISKDNGYELKSVDPKEVAGKCENFEADSKTTTIIGGKGDKDKIKERIDHIKGLIEQTGPNEKTIRENLEGRRDTLESGVGIIYAGGSTEIEIKDRMLRLEDAVLASKSAVKEGYVSGGGLTYLELSKLANSKILRNSLQSVTRQIAENAGKNPDSIIEGSGENGIGYNAKADKFENLAESGVIDAYLVVKNALKNAVSLSSMFLTTEVMVVEYDDKPVNKDELKFK